MGEGEWPICNYVGLLRKQLVTAVQLFDVGKAHVRASGGNPEVMLDGQLIRGMHSLGLQIVVASNSAETHSQILAISVSC